MLLLVGIPVVGVLLGLPTGLFKERMRVYSWQRVLLTLSPFALAPLLPFTGALVTAGCVFLGQQVGSSLVGVGLTGGIATGKSTVSKVLKEHGAVIVDADVIAREVVLPGHSAYKQIVKAFGEGVLNEEDKTLDRAKLGAMIFSDPSKRKVLNACTHKYIIWEMFKQLVYHRLVRRQRLVVFDAPLLFETQVLQHFCYPIIVVACSESNELARLVKRDNLKSEDAQKRIQSQMKLQDKVAMAHLVIQNDGSVDDLVANALATLQRSAVMVGAMHEVLE